MAWNMRSIGNLLGRPPGRLPDFLGLGAQKAGTTTLHRLLRNHPGVFVPAGKEVHYFSLHSRRPLRWYASRFAAAGPGRRSGDITPYYLFHPEAPTRIAAAVPHARLVVLVRDPVERALSGYFHAVRHDMEPLAIEAAFDAEEERLRDADRVLASPGGRHSSHWWHAYVARSRYEAQLARYLDLFPRDRMLIARSEDLFADPHPTWTRIQEFLGLQVVPPPATLPRANAGAGEAATVPPGLRARLRTRLESTYVAMRRDFGIEWPATDAGDGRHVG